MLNNNDITKNSDMSSSGADLNDQSDRRVEPSLSSVNVFDPKNDTSIVNDPANASMDATDAHSDEVILPAPRPVSRITSQSLDNLPDEIRNSHRFFAVKPDKKPVVKGWNLCKNQTTIDEAVKPTGFVGFDTTARQDSDCNLMFIDCDHIFKPDGSFVTDKAKFIVSKLMQLKTYAEFSQSGSGLHFLCVPTAPDLRNLKMASGEGSSIYLTDRKDKDCPKVEFFFNTSARYCFPTGSPYGLLIKTVARGHHVDSILHELIQLIVNENGHSPRGWHNTDELSLQSAADDSSSTLTRDKASLQNDPEYDLARAREMLLKFISPNCSFKEWSDIAAAFKSVGGDFEEFDRWSSGGSTYDPNQARNTWNGMHAQNHSVGTLHAAAKKEGYSESKFSKQWRKDHPTGGYDIFKLPFSDQDNAKRLIDLFGERIRYSPENDSFLLYQPPVWKLNQSKSLLLPLTNQIADLMATNAHNKSQRDFALKMKSRRNSDNAIYMLKSFPDIHIKSNMLNSKPLLLNVRNGVIDLSTGKLLQHDPAFYFTRCADVEFIPGLRSEIVDNFLGSILPDTDTRNSLLRFLGYCLTGFTREEKALFIVGSGRNGKGTLIHLLNNVFGDFATSLRNESLSQLAFGKDADSVTPELAKLQWRRLAIVDEFPAARKLDEAKFQALTGGDPVSIRRLHHEAEIIDPPSHKLILSGRHLPVLSDPNDIGLDARLIVIHFTETFTGNKADMLLKDKLSTDDSRSAFLNILVEHCIAWQHDGLLCSEAMNTTKRDYLASEDAVDEFIAEFCDLGADCFVLASTLIKEMKRSGSDKLQRMTDRELRDAVKKIHGIVYRRKKNGFSFDGIKLRANHMR